MSDDKTFTGSIPALYESMLVPLIFESYADDLARRAAALAPARVLEIAAGTGVVTRRLTTVLPASTSIVATDLNQAMLDEAARRTTGAVTWRQADAQQLPFDDASVDLVVCQFGAMFFPDKPSAFAQVRRVLAPGGTFLFNVWDRLEENEFADAVTQALAELFPDDPPRFFARTPHGYHDVAAIRRDLEAGGFQTIAVETVAARSRAATADVAANGFCQGSPLVNEILARDASGLEAATRAVRDTLARRFGPTDLDGRIQAHVFSVTR